MEPFLFWKPKPMVTCLHFPALGSVCIWLEFWFVDCCFCLYCDWLFIDCGFRLCCDCLESFLCFFCFTILSWKPLNGLCTFCYRANDKELRECRDQIQMYQEMTAVKDQVVVSLTNQVNRFRRYRICVSSLKSYAFEIHWMWKIKPWQ